MQTLVQHQRIQDDVDGDDFSSEIILTKRGYTTVSLFDDPAYQGQVLDQYCLYDYCAQFYKYKRLNGILFAFPHP